MVSSENIHTNNSIFRENIYAQKGAGAERGKWEGLEGGKEREKCCNYIITLKNKSFIKQNCVKPLGRRPV